MCDTSLKRTFPFKEKKKKRIVSLKTAEHFWNIYPPYLNGRGDAGHRGGAQPPSTGCVHRQADQSVQDWQQTGAWQAEPQPTREPGGLLSGTQWRWQDHNHVSHSSVDLCWATDNKHCSCVVNHRWFLFISPFYHTIKLLILKNLLHKCIAFIISVQKLP